MKQKKEEGSRRKWMMIAKENGRKEKEKQNEEKVELSWNN